MVDSLKNSMEENLIPKLENEEKSNRRLSWAAFVEEIKRVGYLAGPMVAVTLSQYLLQVISTMMVGHLGELALSSSAIAISLAGVTGFSLLLGMACALETLCGQAYGAQQYQKLGIHTYTAIFCLILVCIPLSVLWLYMGRLLVFVGQDPLISQEAALNGGHLSYLSCYLGFYQIQSWKHPSCLCVSTPLQHFMPYHMDLVLQQGKPQAARVAVYAALTITVFETLIVSGSLFASRRVFGYVYSNEKEVVDYVTTMAPLVCVSVILDSLQGVLSGIARGCGWQHVGAYVNLGAFYLVGIPVAAILAFWLQLKGVGLWIGVQSGAFTQTILLAIVTSCINWENQAIKARERLFQGSSSIEYGTM